MFSKILIANRGEIAVRIMRTAQEMGVATVAVYSDADVEALHVRVADQAVRLGEPEPAASYLNIERIIEAAKHTGAQAIHPGYGFLAENPAFPDAVEAAGLTFIGPSGAVMRKLGDKIAARRVAEAAGVPMTPGMREPADDPDVLNKEAQRIGYPVLIKAAAGGGGKGMRVVNEPGELAQAAELASGEAAGAFGDGRIYLEKYIERPRHVEIQVLADNHGNAVHLFERECSIQRRHQKIIEETPSPVLDEDLRGRMGEAAVSLVKAAGYTNAGTVEFLLDEDKNFHFLEVNTRLQVEHPITEMVTGLDLVRQQLMIASGAKLAFAQEDLTMRGHAIECRIYAENPAKGFTPSPGDILLTKTPVGPGVRYDSGIETGSTVPVHYDPILGKLITFAENRERNIERMVRALENCVVLGVHTGVEYMIEVLRSEPFKAGETHTHFLEEHFADWKPAEEADLAAAAGFQLDEEYGVRATGGARGGEGKARFASPWDRLGKWDMVG